MKRILLTLILAALLMQGAALAEISMADYTLNIPSGTKTIEAEAFTGVGTAWAVTLPDGLTTIGDRAFKDMRWLSNINIPASVTSIGADILDGTMGAVLVTCEPNSTAMSYAIRNNLDFDADTTCRALLIGNEYRGTVDELIGTHNDVAGMEAMLSRLTGRPFVIVPRYDVKTKDFDSAISEAFAGAKAQDISLFYYSGHGTEDGELCGNEGGNYTLAKLRQALDNVAGRKIVLLDSCFSGRAISDGKSKSKAAKASGDALASFQNAVLSAFKSGSSMRKAPFNPSEYFVITAARYDQTSLLFQLGGKECFSLFTYYMTLSCGYDYVYDKEPTYLHADEDGNGAVSIGEIYDYIDEMMDVEFPDPDDLNRQDVQAYPENCYWFAPFRMKL